MWLPLLLSNNEAEMQELGLKLTAEDLYSINNSSLKDAVVSLNYGSCTAEIVSDQGLVLTNHHCAFDVIQSHSTLKNDYLTDGFWAMNKSDELPNEDLSVSFLISMTDVTQRISDSLASRSSGSTKEAALIKMISKEIVDEATEGGHYNARVKSFFGGNRYLWIL